MNPYPSQWPSDQLTSQVQNAAFHLVRFDLTKVVAITSAGWHTGSEHKDIWQAIITLLGLTQDDLVNNAPLVQHHWEQLIKTQAIVSGELWLATDPSHHGHLTHASNAACLTLILPGRTASLCLSPSQEDDTSKELLRQVIQNSIQYTEAGHVTIFQVLTEPASTQIDLLASCAFRSLATMTFLMSSLARIKISAAARRWQNQRPIPILTKEIPEKDSPEHTYLLPYQPELKSVFLKTIETSYQGTLDCPALVGLRSMEDVWTAHQTTGQFTPECWFLIVHQNEPAGVVLLNHIPPFEDQDHQHTLASGMMELVYMGIIPAKRGLGLGSQSLIRACERISELGFKLLSIAVDESNQPALKVYGDMNLTVMLRKHVMIKTG